MSSCQNMYFKNISGCEKVFYDAYIHGALSQLNTEKNKLVLEWFHLLSMQPFMYQANEWVDKPTFGSFLQMTSVYQIQLLFIGEVYIIIIM